MKTLILEKLQKNQAILLDPTIIFSDFDGTLYSPNTNMWKAPLYNRRTSRLMKKHHLPFVIITGRPDWTSRDELEVKGFGIQHTDAVICGAGTQLHYRTPQGRLIRDTNWEKELMKQLFTWQDETGTHHTQPWNKKMIVHALENSRYINYFSLAPDHDTDLVVRYTIKNSEIGLVNNMLAELVTLLPKGVKFELAEKLFLTNTLQTFSGDLLLIPQSSGKDEAIKHMLKMYASTLEKPIHALCFGDSSVDLGMLTLPKTAPSFFITTYGVDLTPRAFKHLHDLGKSQPHIHFSRDDGPSVLYNTIKMLIQKPAFTRAQNNATRKLLRPFESMANTLIYPNLTANELSFKGLALVTQSIDMLYDAHQPYLQKLQLIQTYLLGMSLDMVDGMRARRQMVQTSNGQLVDVFCDRAKEFYQVYKRAQKRLKIDEEQGYQTVLAAMSCVLPSLARAQAEEQGIIVKEWDEKGGSMLSRTKKLFQAIWFDIHSKPMRSYAIDHAMYKANMATYHSRMKTLEKGKVTLDSSLQEKAKQRVILLSHLAKQESMLLQQVLKSYPRLDARFKEDMGVLLLQVKPTSALFLRDFDLNRHLTLDN